MADELPIPKSRTESYLAKAAGEDVPIPEEPRSRLEQYLNAIAENGGGGGGGTNNFNQLTNRPKYNSTTMTGNTNIPKVPTKTSELSNDSNFVASGSLATVATTGAYSDLSGTPTIPVVNNATLTVTQNGTSVGTFTANSSTDTTIAVTDTTYSNFTGTDGSSAGAAGLVPAPATTDAGKFLKADGTWDTAGGGSGPTVVQTTGTSTTDVMSQNAVTSMVFADPSTKRKVQIGAGAISGSTAVAIGANASANYSTSIAIGGNSTATYAPKAMSSDSIAIGNAAKVDSGCSMGIAIGTGAHSTAQGQMDIGIDAVFGNVGYNNSAYRLLTGLYDGQSAHDAATVGQITPTTDSSAPTTSTAGRLGEIRIDTTDNSAYMCVVSDSTTPAYEWKKITA